MPTIGGQPIHVLIVDDDAGSRLLMRRALERTGFVISEAADGMAAVAAVEAGECNAVLMDVEMPAMNGYDACRAIRAQPGGKDAIVVAITGWGQEQDRRRSEEAGFDAHLVKPVGERALREVIARGQTRRA